ncbi:hypothetical protein QUA95_30870 [Microcoleus sp. F10_A2]|uniref:hypothetical protein n=1 Tax=Microcoleus sp. F10_A2 TaxID=3055338 RepID=UPI002FD13CF9
MKLKNVGAIALFASIIFFGALGLSIYLRDQGSYLVESPALEDAIENMIVSSTKDFVQPSTLPWRKYNVDLEGCRLRIEVTLDEQKVCANTAIDDRLLVYRTEVELADYINVRLLNDEGRDASLLLFSVVPSMKDDPNLSPVVRSGIQCNGREAENYKSKEMASFTFPINSVSGIDELLLNYIEVNCKSD